MLGLEIGDATVVAVAVDDTGAVRARADEAINNDAASAALTALRRVAVESADPSLGIAAMNPDAATLQGVLGSLKAQYAGIDGASRVTSSGIAAAVAEAWVGAAADAKDVAYLSIAEHTSAGIVRGGAPEVGAHGRAASIAWLALNPVEREDYRKSGCLEAEVAAAGIVRRLVWRIKAGDRSRIQEMVSDDLGAITVEHVLQAARNRDGVSISVLRDTAKYVGMAAANLVVIADPDALVLGGIVATASDLLLDPVKTEIARRLPEATMRSLVIATAKLGADAAAIGAARLNDRSFRR